MCPIVWTVDKLDLLCTFRCRDTRALLYLFSLALRQRSTKWVTFQHLSAFLHLDWIRHQQHHWIFFAFLDRIENVLQHPFFKNLLVSRFFNIYEGDCLIRLLQFVNDNCAAHESNMIATLIPPGKTCFTIQTQFKQLSGIKPSLFKRTEQVKRVFYDSNLV